MQAGEKKSVGEGDRGSTSLSLRHPSIQLELKYDGTSKYPSCDGINGAFSSFMIGQGRARRGRGRATNNHDNMD